MRNAIYLLSFFALGMILIGCSTKADRTETNGQPDNEALFLGQKPPGLTPELFAPGQVSTEHLEIEAAISPTMDEFFFIRQKPGEAPKSHRIQYKDGVWHASEEVRPTGEVFISPDNTTMHLGNSYKKRTPTGWTAEESIGEQFEAFPIMRLTASAANTYFFDERDTIGTIRYARIVDGLREAPQPLGLEINTGTFTSHPFIAPDESYLIWDSEREGGFGGSDLYISFHQADGSWGPAINMGQDINTAIDDTYGSVTADGKYFFFNRVKLGESFADSQANIFWVDAAFLEQLQHQTN